MLHLDFLKIFSSTLENVFSLYKSRRLSPTECFLLFQMFFDMLPLPLAEKIFPVLDNLSEHFRSDKASFSAQAKQCMLRLCNDLLRRLSSTGSRDIKFSGQVQLFLTRLFPLDEKSALNLPSNFHLENITEFVAEEDTSLPLDDDALKEKKTVCVDEDAKKRMPSEDGELEGGQLETIAEF